MLLIEHLGLVDPAFRLAMQFYSLDTHVYSDFMTLMLQAHMPFCHVNFINLAHLSCYSIFGSITIEVP
jgi:hypothetical protein